MHDDNRPRRVIPRWRPSWVTATTVEAKSQKLPEHAGELKSSAIDEIKIKRRELSVSKTVPVAAELMFLAASSGNEEAAQEAARLILANEQNIGSGELIKTAKKVLDGRGHSSGVFAAKDFVRRARALLSIDYNNPVIHTDIALALTSLQQNDAALKYIRMAQNLAPQSRFVTRAVTRYFLHIGDHEAAHQILKRSPLLKEDPWIKASEIAVATLRGRTSVHLKQVLRDFDMGSSVQCTELYSAAGTVELMSGVRKKAKLLFNSSLKAPNDNSVAQAEWAASRLNLVVDENALNVPRSFEANSHNAYRRQEISEAIDYAKQWADDEPFASRPLDALCYFLSLDERYDEAREYASSLASRARDDVYPALNLLFTRILTGDLDAALEDFFILGKHAEIKSAAPHYLANGGALAYALNDFEKGREFYVAAIKAAKMKGEPHSEALARAYFARMAKRAGDPQADSIIKESVEAVPRLPSAGAIYVMHGLASESKKKELDKIASKRVAKPEWRWDAITNTLKLLQ